ncbi:MAG: flap endonuclease-1 [Candidatus Micrarchaeota archaeon]|nr:flap endonuclease-1 [Candidatus Micrarchaeota archaeon]
MGCDLSALFKPTPISLEALANKKIAVDGNNILYQFLSSIRQPDGSLLMDSKGNITAHLSGLFYRTLKWLEYGISPIFVFDGEPFELKSNTLLKREERKEKAKEKFTEAIAEGDLTAAFSYAQQTSKLTPEMIEQAKELLDAMGIPYIQAPSEGEAQAAYLVKEDIAWAVASQDYDSLLFGAKKLLRNISFSGKRKVPKKNIYINIEPELIELEKELSELNLTQQKLVWIAILVGTDFNEGIYKVGPKTAFKLVKEAKTFEELKELLLIKFQERKEEILNNLEQHKKIEEFFLSPPINKNFSIEFKEINNERIFSILVDRYEFSPERVERALEQVNKIKKEHKSQRTLDSFF